jgi:hypothetical protein
VDRRVLAAFCCVNAITGNSVLEQLPVIAPQWSLKPNRSGLYLIFDGPGLRPLTTQFVPSSTWPSPVYVRSCHSGSQPSLFAAPGQTSIASESPGDCAFFRAVVSLFLSIFPLLLSPTERR